MVTALRLFAPLLLAMFAAFAVDRWSARRRLQPPGFEPAHSPRWLVRRQVALAALAVALYVGVFQPLAGLGLEVQTSFEGVSSWQLFVVHAVLVAALATWYTCGFLALPRLGDGVGGWRAQLGWVARRPWLELGLGLVAGVVGWGVVVTLMVLASLALVALGVEGVLPKELPPAIVFLAGLPWPLRAVLALSAGVVEETFFRGFLQPRIGLAATTVLFALAHLGYGQPVMLVGITLLSVWFGILCIWRQSVWAAVVAHAVFDGVQLLVLIPLALRAMGT